MSDERQMILQMVADGKITPEEAEKLLQAIEEAEEAARSAATENVYQSGAGQGQGAGPDGASFRGGPGHHGGGFHGGPGHHGGGFHGGPGHHGGDFHGGPRQQSGYGVGGFMSDLGSSIERVVSDSLRALDESMRHLEISLDHRLNEQARRDLREKIEDRVRRATERAMEQAQAAQDRTERAAERATRRAAEHAERAARRMDERLARRAEYRPETIVRTGVSIDREIAEQREQVVLPAETGDLFTLDSRVGDITVSFYEGSVIEADFVKRVWGADKADAEARAAATKVALVRRGSTVDVEITRPNVVGVGVLIVKDTRIDFDLRVPYGTHLRIKNKVGDLKVIGGPKVTSWELETKVGNIDVTVPETAGFRYECNSSVGAVEVAGDAAKGVGQAKSGRVGDGAGFIDATVKTGDIRIHNG